MSIIKSVFGKKNEHIHEYADFWNWFVGHQAKFHEVIKQQGDVPGVFFDQIAPKLGELRDGFWFQAGMKDSDTAELIITAEGVVKNVVFVEELISAAPDIPGWQFTALKPPSGFGVLSIEMNGLAFDDTTMAFYANETPGYPDEIDITITHKDYNETNQTEIINGVYLCLDNALGELKSVTVIDSLQVINTADAEKELVPMDKLADFLNWREKEFVEKYDGIRHSTENDNYSGIEAKLENGLPLVAVINMDLLAWNGKASHPWLAIVRMSYDGGSNAGMPNKATYQHFNEIEDELMSQLKDVDGYLNIGRETGDNLREIYFSCVEFRKLSKVLYTFQEQYSEQTGFTFDIYKDKYWQSFNKFLPY